MATVYMRVSAHKINPFLFIMLWSCGYEFLLAEIEILLAGSKNDPNSLIYLHTIFMRAFLRIYPYTYS